MNGVPVIQDAWGFPMDRNHRGSAVTSLSNWHRRNQRAASALQAASWSRSMRVMKAA